MIAEKAVVAGNSLGYDGPADWYPPPETPGSADLRGGPPDRSAQDILGRSRAQSNFGSRSVRLRADRKVYP